MYFQIIIFLARLGSMPIKSSFTTKINFNCFTPYFHRSTEFISKTVDTEAVCAARCLLSCDRPQESDNNDCQYYTTYGNTCVTGNLENKPSTDGDLKNPLRRLTSDFGSPGIHPLVPIRYKNPPTGSLDLVDSFPTDTRDTCDNLATNQVFSLSDDGDTILLNGENGDTLAIPAGHTNEGASDNKRDDCFIYIQNKDNLQLSLSLTSFESDVSKTATVYSFLFMKLC